MKRITVLLSGILLLVFLGATVCFAATEYEMQIPDGCKKLCCDSNSQGAFSCGFSGKTVYSLQLLPNFRKASVTASGNVKSVCQSGKFTYALVSGKMPDDYYVLELNPLSGAYKFYNLDDESDIDTSFVSVSDGFVFVIKKDALYAYVKRINLTTGKIFTYKFNDNVTKIFNNNGATYAVLYDGSVYRLCESNSSYCTSINQGTKISNAGAGYIRISTGEVVSLSDGSRSYVSNVSDNCVSVSGGNTYYAIENNVYIKNGDSTKTYAVSSAARAVTSCGEKAAVITQSGKCVILNKSDFKSKSLPQADTIPNEYIINSDGILCGVKSGTTVAEFKSRFPSDIVVYDNKGSAASSGKLRTNYSVTVNFKTYPIAVAGDVAGAGDIKSNDVSELMDLFVGKKQMTSLLHAAADFNLDGCADNRDLVLIAKQAKYN